MVLMATLPAAEPALVSICILGVTPVAAFKRTIPATAEFPTP